MKHKIFIDGASGTTGLVIRERLEKRDDIEVITLPEESRKDLAARKDAALSADISILCLPDEASKAFCRELPDDVRVIDTSTAHRVADGWVYGMPELSEDARERIQSAYRVANPGCHASGFILLAEPLIESGILKRTADLTVTSLTGYSGGGKKMIAEYEEAISGGSKIAPSLYAVDQGHKHIPEMMKYSGLASQLVFSPIVCDYYEGMLVSTGIKGSMTDGPCTPERIFDAYKDKYASEPLCEVVMTDEAEDAMLLSGSDRFRIAVSGKEDTVIVSCSLDNLGKGASGAAVQNMNIMLGIDELTGLRA